MRARMALHRVLMYAGDPDRQISTIYNFTSARRFRAFFAPTVWLIEYGRGGKRVVLGTFQRLRNGKSCGIPGSGMILAIESYQRC